MNDVALAALQLCFTSMLIVAVVQRKQRRRQRRKAPYHVRKRRGPLRKERLQWSYSSWHDDEFRKNYRMDKQHFKDLVELVRDDLPGGSELSRERQGAAGGNPMSAETQLSMTLRCLAGGSYLDICRLRRVPNGSFRMVIKRTVRAIVTVLNDKELVAFPIDDPGKLQRIAGGYSARRV